MHVTDFPLRRVLQALASSYGLNLREESGAYYLTLSRPDNPTSYWAATTRNVPLNYLSPSRALLMLPDTVLPYVHPSRDGNALVVDGPEVATGLTRLGPQTVSDQQWNSFEGLNLAAGDEVSLKLSGLTRAESPAAGQPGQQRGPAQPGSPGAFLCLAQPGPLQRGRHHSLDRRTAALGERRTPGRACHGERDNNKERGTTVNSWHAGLTKQPACLPGDIRLHALTSRSRAQRPDSGPGGPPAGQGSRRRLPRSWLTGT
jgi:hypothetical protein